MWALYSAEEFPKWTEDGWADYVQALGVQVTLKAKEWKELEGQDGDGLGWRITHYGNWIDAAGDARETFVSCKQVAERIAGQYRLRGVRCADLDRITPEQKQAIEKDSEAANLRFRELFCRRFEHDARAYSLHKPGGRATCTPYEEECFKILGRKIPDFGVSSQSEPVAAPQIVMQQPDPEYIAMLVRQEMEKLTAPAK